MTLPRLGTAGGADALLADIRAKRQRLAASVRAALLDLDRHPTAAFPNSRQPQLAHEREMLSLALAPLLSPPPEVIPAKGTLEADLQRTLKTLDDELELNLR